MAVKFIVKKDDEIVLETESKAKAERLYDKIISSGRRYESAELIYPPFSKTDASTAEGV